jgi:hypothetical protein
MESRIFLYTGFLSEKNVYGVQYPREAQEDRFNIGDNPFNAFTDVLGSDGLRI